ncbi:keratinolytic protein [Colletotrichum tofieldiae]|nr:keratinolytic protein [Colletotrichum tofieldiae]
MSTSSWDSWRLPGQPAAPILQENRPSGYNTPARPYFSLRPVSYGQSMAYLESPVHEQQAERPGSNYSFYSGHNNQSPVSRSGMQTGYYLASWPPSAAPSHEQRGEHTQEYNLETHESRSGLSSYYSNDNDHGYYGIEVSGNDNVKDDESADCVIKEHANPHGLVEDSRGFHDHETNYASDFEYEEYDGLAEDLDESQLSGEDYFGDNEEGEIHKPCGQYNEEYDEFDDDVHWAAQVDPRCYCLDLGGLDPDEPVGKSPSPEEIERRYTAFLPQWNKINWQAPIRNPLSHSVSPRASIRPGHSRALSVISISSDESESSILSVLGDLGNESNSSIEFLGVSPVKPRNDASHNSDATLKENSECAEVEQDNFKHHLAPMQALQEQENADARDFELMPVLVDLIEEPAEENVYWECNKRRRESSVEFLFEFQRNVRPRQH